MKNKKPKINFLHIFGYKCFVLRNQGENLGKFEAKADEAIFVGYAATETYGVYNLRMNIIMESVHIMFDNQKIQGLVDEGNHDSLQFENEFIGDHLESDEEENSLGKSISVDITPSMNNFHPSMDNLSFYRIPSTDNSTIIHLYSSNRSMNLSGASQSQRSVSNHRFPLNDQEASSSKSNLPPQRKWTKSHPFDLIIEDARVGVKTRTST